MKTREVRSGQQIRDGRIVNEQVAGCLDGTAEEEQDKEHALLACQKQCHKAQ